MQSRRDSEHIAIIETHRLATGFADDTACFTHEQDPAREIPRRETELEKGLETARGNVRKVECRGAHPPHAGDVAHHARKRLEVRIVHAVSVVGNARSDERAFEGSLLRNAQGFVAQPRASTELGSIQLLLGDIEHHCGHHLSIALERDRDREMRDAVQEVGRAVKRIDDQAIRVALRHRRTLLKQERVIWKCRLQLRTNDLLRAQVGAGYEIARSFGMDLELLASCEVALE